MGQFQQYQGVKALLREFAGEPGASDKAPPVIIQAERVIVINTQELRLDATLLNQLFAPKESV